MVWETIGYRAGRVHSKMAAPEARSVPRRALGVLRTLGDANPCWRNSWSNHLVLETRSVQTNTGPQVARLCGMEMRMLPDLCASVN